MFKKSLVRAAMAAILILTPVLSRATTVTSGDVGITATVDQFAEWATVAPIAATDFDGHITQVNQTRTAHEDLTLYANVGVTLAATTTVGSPDYSGILTDASATYTLATAYSISGGGITGSGSMLAPAAFFNSSNTYALAHTPGQGSYTVTLTVTASSPAASAPEAGDYSCGLSLTATW